MLTIRKAQDGTWLALTEGFDSWVPLPFTVTASYEDLDRWYSKRGYRVRPLPETPGVTA